jgi:hypothetical protein
LRLHVQDVPKPVDVKVETEDSRPFPWDQYDQITERFFDQVPVPWPSIGNSFNHMLTDLGFGKKYRAEFFHGGKVLHKDFDVTQSPPHYDAAPKVKSAALGLTVRDLTFDVRRYFQMEAADPGVVISKIESGSKGSVAGLKPYEVITRVNDLPVANAKEFEKNVGIQGDLRLTIKRMTRTRLVKIDLGEGGEGKIK